MSNHSDFPGDSPIPDALRREMAAILKEPLIGATGEHPEGKLTERDEGSI